MYWKEIIIMHKLIPVIRKNGCDISYLTVLNSTLFIGLVIYWRSSQFPDFYSVYITYIIEGAV